jgi:hypothetical protein
VSIRAASQRAWLHGMMPSAVPWARSVGAVIDDDCSYSVGAVIAVGVQPQDRV